MQTAPLPFDEAKRLAALKAYRVLDTPPEAHLDELTALAAEICGTPMAAISLVDTDRQWFKSRIGIDATETPRDISFCAHAILQRQVFEVPDATQDPRFADNPLVTGDMHLRSYAGAPLVSVEGQRVGALCVMDKVPHTLTTLQRRTLEVLGRQVVAHLELRRQAHSLVESETRLQLVADNSIVGMVIVGADRRFAYANRAFLVQQGLPDADITGRGLAAVLGRVYEEEWRGRLDLAFGGERVICEWQRTMEPVATLSARFEPAIGEGMTAQVVVVVIDVTSERTATLTAARLAAIVESSTDAIIGKDLQGIVQSWNRAAEMTFGYTAAEMIGASITTLIPDDRLHEERRILETIASGQRVPHLETVRRHRDGHLLDVAITASPIRDANGRVVGASKIARDISERKRAERLLREQEARLRLFVEHSPAAVAMLDRDMCYLVVSRRWMQDFRLGDASLIGRSHYDVFPDLPTRWREIHARCLAGAVETCEEDSFTHPDGRVDWLRWETRPWFGSDDAIGGIIIFSEDITERKRAEMALREADARTQFVLKNAQVGVWDLDVPAGVVRWSEVLEAHCGLSPGTFGGTLEHFIACIHPDDREHVRHTIAQTMVVGGDFELEHRVVRPDGAIRWLRGAGRVVLGPDGAPARAVGIAMDITSRRALEAQYQQAQKMEAVGRLAGGVAHDFNNLLTAILGYCEFLIAEFPEGDQRRADLDQIFKAANAAAALTRQLLAFSRKQIVEPKVLDLNVVVRQMESMVARLIGEDVRVTFRLDPAPVLVEADHGQLEQVVMNLAVNARDAMPTGGALTIETSRVTLDAEYVASHFAVTPGAYSVLTVTDSGTGMSAEVQSHLFEPFFTTKDVGKGTGLGLATVHGIVTQAGGTIGVYSEVGRGTTFKIYFPAASGSVEAASVRVAPQPGRGESLLLVEDEAGLRALTSRMLVRQGYTVFSAGHAEEAIQIFNDHPEIALVLTDVVMPGESGPDLARMLMQRKAGLKVVYMSGYTEEAIVQHGVVKDGIDFLHKPFTSDTLGAKLRAVLDRP